MNAKELYLKETGKDRTRACFEQIPSVTEHYISWLEKKVAEQHQALQLQQTGVIKSLPDYELEFCERCFQMTNHLNNKCQKCKGNVL